MAEHVANIFSKQECCLELLKCVPSWAGGATLFEQGLTWYVLEFQAEGGCGLVHVCLSPQ